MALAKITNVANVETRMTKQARMTKRRNDEERRRLARISDSSFVLRHCFDILVSTFDIPPGIPLDVLLPQ
jgi:hypothetical protein